MKIITTHGHLNIKNEYKKPTRDPNILYAGESRGVSRFAGALSTPMVQWINNIYLKRKIRCIYLLYNSQ
jgi:hypothetical protein